MPEEDDLPPPVAPPETLSKAFVLPSKGEVITSLMTGNSYEIGPELGEGNFGIVYQCIDVWRNTLAAKVLKPKGTYEKVRQAAEAEFLKLMKLRHPNITYVFDAFEYRDTFYIITEHCTLSLADLFGLNQFNGSVWLTPVARCLLQAVHYLHINQYAHQDIHLGNVLTAFVKDEMNPAEPGAIQFKLADLGVSRVFSELDAMNTLNDSIRPPEGIDPKEFGPLDHRIDIYQTGLVLLQFAYSKTLEFSRQEVQDGRPREMALSLPPPLNFALEKALRRHVMYRTANAMELWRDLNSPDGTAPALEERPVADALTAPQPPVSGPPQGEAPNLLG